MIYHRAAFYIPSTMIYRTKNPAVVTQTEQIQLVAMLTLNFIQREQIATTTPEPITTLELPHPAILLHVIKGPPLSIGTFHRANNIAMYDPVFSAHPPFFLYFKT